MMGAAEQGSDSVVQLLLESGADPLLKGTQGLHEGKTALDIAAEKKQHAVYAVLLPFRIRQMLENPDISYAKVRSRWCDF